MSDYLETVARALYESWFKPGKPKGRAKWKRLDAYDLDRLDAINYVTFVEPLIRAHVIAEIGHKLAAGTMADLDAWAKDYARARSAEAMVAAVEKVASQLNQADGLSEMSRLERRIAARIFAAIEPQ